MINYNSIKNDLEGIEDIIKLLQNKQFEDVALLTEDSINNWADYKFSYDYYDYTALYCDVDAIKDAYKIAIYNILESIISLKEVAKYLN